MVNMDNVLEEVLDRYYNAVTKTGYINNCELNKVIIVMFL